MEEDHILINHFAQVQFMVHFICPTTLMLTILGETLNLSPIIIDSKGAPDNQIAGMLL